MAVRIAIANVRGGVGKSTTSMMLAEGLALKQLRVLVIDIDPQAMVTELLLRFDGCKQAVKDGKTLAHVLARMAQGKALKLANARMSGSDLAELHEARRRGKVDVIASNTSLLKDLADIEQSIRARYPDARLDDAIARLLQVDLTRLETNYDVTIFDCQAGTTPLNLAALRLAQHVIAPTNLEDNSFAKLMDFVRIILNDDLGLAGQLTVHVLFTMFVADDPQQKSFLKFIKSRIKGLNYLPRPIPFATAIQRAASDAGTGRYRTATEKYGEALDDVDALASEMMARTMSMSR